MQLDPLRNLTLSIVEEVRRFVGTFASRQLDERLGLLSVVFSALGDQRAEVLPVQRPLALAVGGLCMMRLRRILVFPFFSTAQFMFTKSPKMACSAPAE